MKRTSRIVAIVCIFSTVFMGCYSHNAITADSPKSASEVSFRLTDGTHVLSHSYQRVENGWKVEGKWVNKQDTKTTDFSGILLDAQIKEVVTNELNTELTVVFVLLGAGFVASCVAFAVELASH